MKITLTIIIFLIFLAACSEIPDLQEADILAKANQEALALGKLDRKLMYGMFPLYVDADEDGFGTDVTIELVDDGSGVFDCDAVPGMSSNMMDCDDADAAVNPNAGIAELSASAKAIVGVFPDTPLI